MTPPVEKFLSPSGQKEWLALFGAAEDRSRLAHMTNCVLRSPAFDQLCAAFDSLPGADRHASVIRHFHVRLDFRKLHRLGWDPDSCTLVICGDAEGAPMRAVRAGSMRHTLDGQQAWLAEHGEGWLQSLGRFILVSSPTTTSGSLAGATLFCMPWESTAFPLTITLGEHVLVQGLDYFFLGQDILWRLDPRDLNVSDAYCAVLAVPQAGFQYVANHASAAAQQGALLRARRDNCTIESLTQSLAAKLGFPLWPYSGVVTACAQFGTGTRYTLDTGEELLAEHEHTAEAVGTAVRVGTPIGAPFQLLYASEYLSLDWSNGLNVGTLFGTQPFVIPAGTVRAESGLLNGGLPVVYWIVDQDRSGATQLATQQSLVGGAQALWNELSFDADDQVAYTNLLGLLCENLGKRGLICSLRDVDQAPNVRAFLQEEHPLNVALLFHVPPV